MRSSLLEEFRNTKNKKYDLKSIVGYFVEFSGDQHGSRFIQQKLESASVAEKELVFQVRLKVTEEDSSPSRVRKSTHTL